MMDIITPVLDGIAYVVNFLRIPAVDWNGYHVTLLDAALSLLIFEKILSCVFAFVGLVSRDGD